LANGPENAPAQAAWPRADSPATTNSPDCWDTEFVGRRGALFWLALKTGILSVLTLGIYRFWMKTRLRRWYWSAIRPGGQPLEYVGDPIEKLLGFFIAVVILAFYIGIVNLLLMFASFSLFQGNAVAYLVSFVGVIPIWFYARYRARRYVLGRTRWQGVRFGLEPGAWGYALRALVHWGITILTLGMLWPRMTFALEKYKTDRTFYGSAKLHQGGAWRMLYPAAIPVAVAVMILFLGGVWVLWLDPVVPVGADMFATIDDVFNEAGQNDLNAPQRLFLLPLALLLLVYGAVHYNAASTRILANHKTADGIALFSHLRPTRVFGIYSWGNTISYLALVLGLVGLFLLAIPLIGLDGLLAIGGDSPVSDMNVPRWMAIGILALVYFGVFLMWSVLSHVFVTFPLMRHYAQTLQIVNPAALTAINQRARDEFAEAEGFAEALDLGAAI
jgi:uncharacterized membrane protein YjgN (DUF898 family)